LAPTGRTSNCRTSQFHTPLTEDPVLTAGARTRKALRSHDLEPDPWLHSPERTGPRSAAVLVRRMRASMKSCCINATHYETVMHQRDSWPQAPERIGPRSAAILVRRMRASRKSCCIRTSTKASCNNPPLCEFVSPDQACNPPAFSARQLCWRPWRASLVTDRTELQGTQASP
jgi:hypothetical protein